MSSSTASASLPAASRRDADWFLALAATAAVVALHGWFLARVGGLYRDEVSSFNLAQGPLSNIVHDSFPILFPLLLRIWHGLGLGGSDLGARTLGALLGLVTTVVFWTAAHWTRKVPPLWSLVLVALNGWVIYYGASLRAYGLGSAMIALCAAAAWQFTQKPGRKAWLLFAAAAVLSVQSLYQNSVLVAAVCAGACAVALRAKKLNLIMAIFFAGLVAAISLLPYYYNVAAMPQGASPLRIDFDGRTALTNLNTLLAFPMPQFFWLWAALIGFVLLRAAAGIFSGHDDRSLFAAVTMVTGAVAFWMFLRLANFPVQPWYFLPPVALAAICLEASLPRPAGKFRAALFGGLAAMAVVSALFSLRVVDYRFTNVDLFAKKTSAAAGTNDLVIVSPWQMGITFARYFHGPCDWMTVPPLEDHKVHRFDLIQLKMGVPGVMTAELEKVTATLRSGGAVWVVGGIYDVSGTNAPASALPPPPLRGTGWNETPYRSNWNEQISWILRRNSTNIECLDRGYAEDVNLVERVGFFKVTGWKD